MAKREMAKYIRLRLYHGCVRVVAGLCRGCVGFKGLCQCSAVIVPSCVGVVPGSAGLCCVFARVLPGNGSGSKVVLRLCCDFAELCWGCNVMCHGFAVVLPGEGSGSKGCVRVVLWFC